MKAIRVGTRYAAVCTEDLEDKGVSVAHVQTVSSALKLLTMDEDGHDLNLSWRFADCGNGAYGIISIHDYRKFYQEENEFGPVSP